MHAHEIEPIFLLRAWLEEFDLAVAKRSEQTFVPYIAHAIKCKLRPTFLEQHRFNKDVVRLGCTSIVVDQS